MGSHRGHRAIGFEAQNGGRVGPDQPFDLIAHGTEQRLRRHGLRDQRGHAPQSRLLLR
jgi:hypothetical protein